MKRCPACKRVEPDDTLTFCRADGTPLISDSGLVRADAGTLEFGSAPVASEGETNILPQHTTDAGVNRATGPTTVLDQRQTINRTQELSTRKRTKAIVFVGAAILMIAVAIVGSVYFFVSRKNNAAIQSIAVLPFVNESGNADVEYLSDGMTESLISSLSQIPKLNVKARSSVFRYKGKSTNVQTIGKELNVQAILNGRVVQRGQDLILYVELVDAATENVLWKQTYNKTMTNLVALQNDIARDVADKLKVKLSGADEQKLAKSYTANAEAYQLYLRGRFYLNKRTITDLQKAAEYFQQATALEPNYALAFAGLADAYSLISIYGGASHDAMPKAKEVALKALSLDNNLAEAHASLGQILDYYDYDFVGAEGEYNRAIELNPNYAQAHHWRGEVLTEQGRFEEAFAAYRRALEIDPLSLIINRMYGHSLLYARQYDAAVVQLKKTIELDAGFPSAHFTLALAYEARGNRAECVEEFAKLHELEGGPQKAALIRESFAKGGWQSFLRTMTGDGRLPNSSAYNTATFYVALGEKDKAFAELNKSYENREPSMRSLKIDPLLDPLRDDPRFTELMRRMRLQQ